MLLIPQYLLLDGAADVPLINTRIGWETYTRLITADDVEVSSETALGPKDAPLSHDTAWFWEPAATPAYYKLDFGELKDLDYVGLVGQFAGRGVEVRFSPDVDDFNDYLAISGADGNYASTPDSAAVSITGDLHLEMELSIENADLPAFSLDFLGDFAASIQKLTGGSPTPGTYTGGNGTYTDVNGVLQAAVTNTPRKDHSPVTRAIRGLLIEESRANVVDSSETLGSGTGWVSPAASNVTVTANSDVWLDGTTTADTVTDSDAAANGRIQHNETVSSSSTTRCGSAHVKKTIGDANFVAFEVQYASGGVGVLGRFVFNSNTGAIASESGTMASRGVLDCGTYWRPYAAVTDNASGNTVFVTSVYPAWNTTGAISGVVTTTGSKVISGFQVETGSFPTSYVKTSSGSVTRAADVATLTDLNAMGFNAVEGTFVVSGEIPTLTSVSRRLAEVNDGLSNERLLIQVGAGNTRDVIGTDGGVSTITMSLATAPTLTPFKMSAAFKANDCAASTDGGTVATDALTGGGLPTVDRLHLASNGTGAFLNGWLRELFYYASRRANAALQDFSRGTYRVLASKWAETSNQRSWALCLKENCALVLFVSTDGTAAGIREYHSAPLTITEGARFRIRVKLDLSAGSPELDSICTFETSDDDGATWDALSTITQATVSGIFDSTAPVEVGAFNGGTSELQAKLFQFWLHADLNEGPVAHFDAGEGEEGDTSITSEDTGEVWTLHSTGPATALNIRRFSVPAAPADDAPLMFLDEGKQARRLRIAFTGDEAPRLLVCYAGPVLAMERPIRGGGFIPPTMHRETVLKQNLSRGGQLLGQTFRRLGLQASTPFQHLSAAWVRSDLEPFIKAARQYPFFIAWRPATYPLEVGFMWATDDIHPSMMGLSSLMQVTIPMRGIGWE